MDVVITRPRILWEIVGNSVFMCSGEAVFMEECVGCVFNSTVTGNTGKTHALHKHALVDMF